MIPPSLFDQIAAIDRRETEEREARERPFVPPGISPEDGEIARLKINAILENLNLAAKKYKEFLAGYSTYVRGAIPLRDLDPLKATLSELMEEAVERIRDLLSSPALTQMNKPPLEQLANMIDGKFIYASEIISDNITRCIFTMLNLRDRVEAACEQSQQSVSQSETV